MDRQKKDTDLDMAASLALEGRLDEARQLYERLANEGSWYAMVQLGYMFLTGNGVTKDFDRAEVLFKQAKSEGSHLGQYYLGLLYEVSKKNSDAFREISELSNVGYLPAINRLGKFYELGIGCDQDKGAALHYRTFAASQGHLGAQKWISLEKLSGGQGFVAIPFGLIGLIKSTCQIFWFKLKYPTDPRVQG